jgi:two-component sensor histidine kinase
MTQAMSSIQRAAETSAVRETRHSTMITDSMRQLGPPAGIEHITPDPWLLVGELTHRVINEYTLAVSSLALAAARTPDKTAKTAILNAGDRLRHFANAHRALQMPTFSGPIDLVQYLRGVCSTIARACLDERGIRLTLIEQHVELEAERCWRVGLIVSELIMNAVRHGFGNGSGSITVEIQAKEEIRCLVTDNGRSAADPRPGHGSSILEALAHELGGHIEREFRADGTRALVSFPNDMAMSADVI